MHHYAQYTGLPHADAATARASSLITTLVEAWFGPLDALAGRPTVSISTSLVTVHVPYYTHAASACLNANAVNSLGRLLASTLGVPVELRLVKLTYPYLDGYVLAQYVSNELAHVKWTLIKQRLATAVALARTPGPMPSYLAGLKVALAGRLVAEPSRPRETTKAFTLGSFKHVSSFCITTQSQYTAVNAKGSYTVTVSLCHLLPGQLKPRTA